MKSHRKLIQSLMAAACATLASSSVHAAVISGSIYEGFNPADTGYTNGAGLSGKTGGSGFGGSAYTLASPSVDGSLTNNEITHSGLPATGLSAFEVPLGANNIATGQNAVDFRSLGQTIDTGTLFVGFLLQRGPSTADNRGSTLNDQGVRAFGFSLFSGTTGEKVDVFGSSTNGMSGSGGARIGTYQLNEVSNVGLSQTAVYDNTVAFAVLRIDFNTSGNNDTVALYLNPSLGTDPSGGVAGGGSPYAKSTTTDIGSIDTFRLFAGGSTGGASALGVTDAYFDEIRIGGNYASVVPEPATIGLLSMGALLGLRRRRRHAQTSA